MFFLLLFMVHQNKLVRTLRSKKSKTYPVSINLNCFILFISQIFQFVSDQAFLGRSEKTTWTLTVTLIGVGGLDRFLLKLFLISKSRNFFVTTFFWLPNSSMFSELLKLESWNHFCQNKTLIEKKWEYNIIHW